MKVIRRGIVHAKTGKVSSFHQSAVQEEGFTKVKEKDLEIVFLHQKLKQYVESIWKSKE